MHVSDSSSSKPHLGCEHHDAKNGTRSPMYPPIQKVHLASIDISTNNKVKYSSGLRAVLAEQQSECFTIIILLNINRSWKTDTTWQSSRSHRSSTSASIHRSREVDSNSHATSSRFTTVAGQICMRAWSSSAMSHFVVAGPTINRCGSFSKFPSSV